MFSDRSHNLARSNAPRVVRVAVRGSRGQIIRLNLPARVVFSQAKLRREVYERTGELLPKLSPAAWGEQLTSMVKEAARG